MLELVKDPFVLGFLAVDPVRERDLSRALTENLSRFLRELGAGWAFVGAEVPLQCGDREFFVDLLFYHCRLTQCEAEETPRNSGHSALSAQSASSWS